ncbi:MAG: TIR domain-containing protein [Anaerolineae bacterium]
MPAIPHSYALIIGVDRYEHPAIVPPPDAAAHAQRLANLLSGPPHDFAIRFLTGPEATKASIEFEIDEMALAGITDRLLVVFFGMGDTLVYEDGTQLGVLACYDTDPVDVTTWLQVDEVMTLRTASGIKQIGYIFDAPIGGEALGLVSRPKLPDGVDPAEVRTHEVISGGMPPDRTYQPIAAHMVSLIARLNSNHEEQITMSTLAKRLQRWLNSQANPPQMIQSGHLPGTRGGTFTFGALRRAKRGKRRHVFLSYIHRDLDIVQRVRSDLSDHGIPVWDDDQLGLSASWREMVDQAIEESAGVVVFLSPESANSAELQRELQHAYSQNRPVYPVLTRGTQDNAIPPELRKADVFDVRDVRHYESQIARLVDELNRTAAAAPTRSGRPFGARPRPAAEDLTSE